MTLRLALAEYDTGWHDAAASLEAAEEIIRRSAEEGARLVALPEMCTTGFTMDAETHAEDLNASSTRRLRSLAVTHEINLIAGLATKEDGRFFNSAVVIRADGSIAGEYRKMRLFSYATEQQTYSAGQRPLIVDIEGVRTATFICFDLRFPELFREVARDVDLIVVIANWPSARQLHWDTLLRARAIESQAFVAGVNRLGSADGLHYEGGSAVIDPTGQTVTFSGGRGVLLADVDPVVVASTRDVFPFITTLP